MYVGEKYCVTLMLPYYLRTVRLNLLTRTLRARSKNFPAFLSCAYQIIRFHPSATPKQKKQTPPTGRVRRKKSQTYSAKAHPGRARTAERCQESGDQSEDRNTANDRTRKRNRRLRRGRKPYATTHSNAGCKGDGKTPLPPWKGLEIGAKMFQNFVHPPGEGLFIGQRLPGTEAVLCCG